MKKSFMNNIKNFVDSNVRHRIDRATNNNNDFFGDDLLLVERQFEEIKLICVEAEKRISALLTSTQSQPVIAGYTHNVQASLNNLSSNLSASNQASAGSAAPSSEPLPSFSSKSQQSKSNTIESSSNTTATTTSNNPLLLLQPPTPTPTSSSNDVTNNDNIRRHKKLPIVGFLKFLVKSCYKLKPDSLLGTTLTHCSQLQAQLTRLYLSYEQTIEAECLRPIQHLLECDAPNVIKLRKLFIKSHNDLESAKAKFNGASQKQQQSQTSHHFTSTSYTIQQINVQQANINKLDQLKKELDEAISRFEQARDNYATELYTFVCRETELVNLFIKFYQHQAEYQQQVGQVISSSLPSLSNTLALTPRKVVFGTPLNEHLRCTGRSVSLVIELSVHLLYLKALREEGLFRIPGSSAKIKKLKSAINAWFVTLASQSELSAASSVAAVNEQGQSGGTGDQVKTSGHGGQSALLVVHQLFKDIVGQRRQSRQPNSTTLFGSVGSNGGGVFEQGSEAGNSNNNSNNKPTMRDDPTLTHQTTNNNTNHLANQRDDQHFVFDVHTIAGLLKLYLRELPEPLFTYALYQQWIDASVKTMNNKLQLGPLERVIQLLPQTNYHNLRHLIRFLHLLTSHSESNKMTSTNLAITMAPSLIWSGQDQQTTASQASLNASSATDSSLMSASTNTVSASGDGHALNIQMTSIGISASLHALVIENLINHSETLFPGPIQFAIPELENGPSNSHLSTTNHQTSSDNSSNRYAKPNSPTGLSTASSSSFSSSSTNASVTSSSNASKTHSRRGGSMEGLLSGFEIGKQTATIRVDSRSSGRPMSVYIPQTRHQQVAPPVPPAPAIRSQSRQAKELNSQKATSVSPAPLPPTTYKRHLNKINPQSGSGRSPAVVVAGPIAPPKPPQPTSCRGTGRIDAPSPTSSQSNATRPSVPPPSRPTPDTSGDLVSSCENVLDQVIKNQPKKKSGVQKLSVIDNNNDNNDSKSYHSMASSGNLRAEFEEINALDVDDIDISVPSISPVVSLDSITGEDDDSSFDNDCQDSLDQSWTDMSDPSSQPTQKDNIAQPSPSETKEQKLQQQSSSASVAHSIRPTIRSIDRQKEEAKRDPTIRQVEESGTLPSLPSNQRPVKPPRCISPKTTQSTPL